MLSLHRCHSVTTETVASNQITMVTSSRPVTTVLVSPPLLYGVMADQAESMAASSPLLSSPSKSQSLSHPSRASRHAAGSPWPCTYREEEAWYGWRE
jgi:hypothetical protein